MTPAEAGAVAASVGAERMAPRALSAIEALEWLAGYDGERKPMAERIAQRMRDAATASDVAAACERRLAEHPDPDCWCCRGGGCHHCHNTGKANGSWAQT